MTFTKHFRSVGGFCRDGQKMVGSAIFGDGVLVIRLPNTKAVIEKGFVEGDFGEGFGVVTKDIPAKKSPYSYVKTVIDVNDLPVELRGQKYKFRIYAEQLSENEFVFPFSRAKMINKK